jgi:hypothetical protein
MSGVSLVILLAVAGAHTKASKRLVPRLSKVAGIDAREWAAGRYPSCYPGIIGGFDLAVSA